MSHTEQPHSDRSEKGSRIDRRAARTQRALHEALIALILRKGYDAITVQEIIDQADIGRATFYAHYSSKEDLLRGGFKRLAGELRSARRAAADPQRAGPLSFSLAMFRHAGEYRQVFRALIGGRGSIIAVNEIRRVLSDVVREELGVLKNDEAQELCVQFVVGAFLAVLTGWLEPRSRLAAEDVDAMFRRLLVDGLAAYLAGVGRRAVGAPSASAPPV
jgi:AcrR family transcriptional regulator